MLLKGVTIVFLLFSMSFAMEAQAYLTPHQYYDPARRLLINSAHTQWDFFDADDETSRTTAADLKLQFVARSSDVIDGNLQPTLTMRVDGGRWPSAQAYAQRWLKDFPKFGFDLQMARDTTFGNLQGYDMELVSKSGDRRARQFIVRRPNEIWVFTCSSDNLHFRSTWKSCEKILQTASAH